MPTFTSAGLNQSLRLVLFWLLLLGVALTSLGVRQVDLWWQLPEGQSILLFHRLPDQPPSAYGLPHRPYIDEYVLYEILLALVHHAGGFLAIRVGFSTVYLLIFLLPLWKSLRRPHNVPALASLALALALVFMVNRYEHRPEIVGVLLLALLVRLLLGTSEFSGAFLLRLAVLFAVWSNVHSSYLVGLLALFLWLIERTFGARRSFWTATHSLLAAAVAGAAVLINPYGWHRVAFTFEQERDLGSNLLSREMWPAWDQPVLVQVILVITAVLLAFLFAPRQRPAGWLIALAGATFLLTLLNIRHMSFLAVTLLFVISMRPAATLSRPGTSLQAVFLGVACVVGLVFDLIALRNGEVELRSTAHGGNSAGAPALDINHGTVLCHDAEGSYLSFTHPGLSPLLDSGQGHFDDDTKRFYFFTVQDPHGFDLALHRLDPGYVIVTGPVLAWTSALAQRPGWRFVKADRDGLVFAPMPRQESSSTALGPDDLAHLRSLRDQALREGNPVWAFSFSVLIDDPADSLALLDRSSVPSWSEAFFLFNRDWVARIPASRLQAFLDAHPRPANPLLRELILARSSSVLPPLPGGASHLERLARVLTLLGRHDFAGATRLFATIPAPYVSTLYYTLRDQLDSAAARGTSRAQRWQDWNADGEVLFRNMPRRLNQSMSRISR